METYAKLFTKAGLIYLVIGAGLGLGIGLNPEWSGRLRFVHIHLNLLGFMTMMIAGVAYHVLPRFNARPVPWPEGVKYHFILQNAGLLGMCGIHLAGGLWREGVLHLLFVGFAAAAGAGLAIMFYNLYFVLTPASAPVPITGDLKVSEILDRHPEALQVFLDHGFTALANPVARRTFARAVTLRKACEKHGVNLEQFLARLDSSVNKAPSSAPIARPATEARGNAPEAVAIRKGESCTGRVRVGSLLEVYPETRAVFEKFYGEGCFSCPGQVFETVEQTAQMHNVDPRRILAEINAVIARGGSES